MPTSIQPPPAQDAPAPETHLFKAVPALPLMAGFIILNAISYQIALGTPLVLLARRWGAPASYIGAITSLVSLLSILQIFLASRLEYIGFKKVMLSGWAARNGVTVLTSLLPLCAGFFSNNFLLTILFVLMFLFNTVRGLASSSWTPWVTSLVPEHLRGRYMSIDQFTNSASSAGAFFLCAWILGDRPDNLRFTLALGISAAAGWLSLYFLKNVPSPPPRLGKPPREPLWSWARRVWRDRAFRRLIRMNVVFALGLAAWEPFTAIFLRDSLHLTERAIMNVTGIKTLCSILSAFAWGALADRFSSRPVLAVASRLMLLAMLIWLLFPLGWLRPSFFLVTVLSVLLQVGWLGFNVANSRYLMNNAPRAMPVLGLSLFSVIVSLSNALSPNLWGWLLDGIGAWRLVWGRFVFDRFTCFYLIMLTLLLATKGLIRRLPDQAASAPRVVVYHMINDYPLRALQGIYKMLFSTRPRPAADADDDDAPRGGASRGGA